MDFIDQIKQFSKRVAGMVDTITTEEATKMSIIIPFFSLLGYDVFNPNEFLPEFTAEDVYKRQLSARQTWTISSCLESSYC